MLQESAARYMEGRRHDCCSDQAGPSCSIAAEWHCWPNDTRDKLVCPDAAQAPLSDTLGVTVTVTGE